MHYDSEFFIGLTVMVYQPLGALFVRVGAVFFAALWMIDGLVFRCSLPDPCSKRSSS